MSLYGAMPGIIGIAGGIIVRVFVWYKRRQIPAVWTGPRVDYKDVKLLQGYVTERQRIRPAYSQPRERTSRVWIMFALMASLIGKGRRESRDRPPPG